MTLFEKPTLIKVEQPQSRSKSQKCLIWEYDLAGMKKIAISTGKGARAYLYDERKKEFVMFAPEQAITLKGPHRLFGFLTETCFYKEEFRLVPRKEESYSFSFDLMDGAPSAFVSPILVTGHYSFSSMEGSMQRPIIKKNMDRIGPDKPLYVGSQTGDEDSGFDRLFHTRAVPFIKGELDAIIGSFVGGAPISQLPAMVSELNEACDKLNDELNEDYSIECKVTSIVPTDPIYEQFLASVNVAATHTTNANVLIAQFKAAQIAAEIGKALGGK